METSAIAEPSCPTGECQESSFPADAKHQRIGYAFHQSAGELQRDYIKII